MATSSREKFLKDLKVDKKDLEGKRQGKRQGKEQERYREKSKTIALQKRKAKQRRKRISAIVAAGLVAFGSYGAKQYYDNNMKSVTLEEALKAGKTPEDFGLDDYIVEELSEVKTALQDKDNLSREDIFKLGEEIENLELSVIKSKIGNELDDYQEIKVRPRDTNCISTITVIKEDGKEVFSETDCLFGDYGSDIGGFIEGINEVQNTNSKYENKQIDRDEALDIYDKSVKKTERFASAEITITDKGKIKFEKTTKASLEKEQANKQAKIVEDEGR